MKVWNIKRIFKNGKEDHMIKNFLLIFIALFLTTSILGCNMLKGAGKDIENGGKNIQKTVDHND